MDRHPDRRTLTSVPVLSVALLATGLAAAAERGANLIGCGSFEGGHHRAAGAGWTLHDDVSIEKGEAHEGDWYLRVKTTEDAAKPNHARLTGIPVKPNTGYVARCWLVPLQEPKLRAGLADAEIGGVWPVVARAPPASAG